MHTQKNNIIMVGAGKVASHLTKRFRKRGINISQIVNRNVEKAKQIACSAQPSIRFDSLENVDTNGDWYILAVSDGAIESVLDFLVQRTNGKGLYTHVSGATPSIIFKGKCARYGVFYPLQSFSKDSKPAWTKIPICIDANNKIDLAFLKKSANTIGKKVVHINDEQRAKLHLSAVFVNNFANHLYTIADALLDDKNASMELLHPIMEETVRKAVQNPPKSVQTGPALRGDHATIKRHLKALERHPRWRELYELLSNDIAENS